MQLVCFLLTCTHAAADGSTSWALYDDDKPVKKMEWEEVAKQQASMLIWSRRHPRQQPLDTPTPRTIMSSLQGRKDSDEHVTNASLAASSCLSSPPCQDGPLPTIFEELSAAATSSSPPSPPCPPPPHQEAQSVQPPIPREEPDAVAMISSHASLDAHVVPTPNEEPDAVTDLSLIPSQFTRPSSPLHHLHAFKPESRCVSPSPPSAAGHAAGQDQLGKQSQAAKPAVTGTVDKSIARAPKPALSASNSRAYSAAHHHNRSNKLSTTSKASAAATGACGATAASGPARTKANCRAGAVAASGPLQNKSKAGAVAASGPATSKAKGRAEAVAAIGPSHAKIKRSGAGETKVKNTARAVAASSSVNTKPDSRAGSASAATKRKPLPAEGRSTLSVIHEGELSGHKGNGVPV